VYRPAYTLAWHQLLSERRINCRPLPGASLLVSAQNPLLAHPSPCFSKNHTWRLCCKGKDSSGARTCAQRIGVQLVTCMPSALRPVLIFLHSRLHQDTQEFILNALTRPEFVEVRARILAAAVAAPRQACCLLQFVSANFIVWGGCVQEPDGFDAAGRFDACGGWQQAYRPSLCPL